MTFIYEKVGQKITYFLLGTPSIFFDLILFQFEKKYLQDNRTFLVVTL